jgi:hypothetical protein
MPVADEQQRELPRRRHRAILAAYAGLERKELAFASR